MEKHDNFDGQITVVAPTAVPTRRVLTKRRQRYDRAMGPFRRHRLIRESAARAPGGRFRYRHAADLSIAHTSPGRPIS
jgi:hypothetical protein